MSLIIKKDNSIFSDKSNSRKGFTFVELIVILAVLAILFGITVFSALAWMDWSRFKHENTVAEELFFAAQNQMIEFDSSGAMKRRVNDVLMNSSGTDYDSKYIIAQSIPNSEDNTYELHAEDTFGDISIDASGNGYNWEEIWLNDQNLKKEKRTIVSLSVNPGDYDDYLAGTLADSGSKLLFELVDSYITDKSVLNGAITLEFSPEAVQVFAVCYSSSGNKLAYNGEGGAINISKRGVSDRESVLLGYYGVDTLTAKLRGRSDVELTHKFEIENGNMLSLILSKKDSLTDDLKAGDVLNYTVYGSKVHKGTYNQIMDFTIEIGDEEGQLNPDYKHNISEANSCVLDVNMKLYKGYYNDGATHKFRVPVWIDEEGSVYVVLDAVDAQAQSLTYATANGLIAGLSEENINAAKKAFGNTFSFYRFGLEDINYIRANVVIQSNGKADEPVEAVRRASVTPYGENGIYGERTTFANYIADYENIANNEEYEVVSKDNIYGISNSRHFYNIRFETDYKAPLKAGKYDESKRLFLQQADINWNDLIDGSYGEGSTTYKNVNFFLNSYIEENTDTNTDTNTDPNAVAKNISGINLSGETVEFKYLNAENQYVSAGTDTTLYPFPSFRMLGFGDTFTQLQTLDVDNPKAQHYKIENINMSFSANCAYGVYGQTVHDDFIAHKNADGINYSTVTDNSKKGYMPLGLFAESYGTVKNLELINVNVKGVEGFALNPSTLKPTKFVFTSKVGGFVGENFGVVSNLFIDENTENATSKISGRGDVGGIVGHQYKKVRYIGVPYDDVTQITIEKCINNADVTGICYVGGIIGRIYPGSSEAGKKDYGAGSEAFDPFGESNNTLVEASELGELFVDEETNESSNLVAFDESDVVLIENCKNYGKIEMEYYFANNVIDGNTYRRGFFYGGITGAALNCYKIHLKKGITYEHYYTDANGKQPNRKAVIRNCESFNLYSEDEIKALIDSQDYKTRISRAVYVGGIVGGARFADIEMCSNTPGSDELEKDENGKVVSYPFVIGDRYVGGIAGYSVETDYTWPDDRSDYTSAELDKIGVLYNATNYASDIAKVRSNNSYSVINGANVIGNFAVGGITGCFGRPDSGTPSKELYKNTVEERFYSKYEYPYGAGQMDDSKYNFTGALNAGAVFGVNYSDGYMANKNCYFGVGGVAGLVTVNINNCDNIQPEDSKMRTLRMIGFETTNKTNASDVLDEVSIEELQLKIARTKLCTDGVGGIVGQLYGHGNFNNHTTYNSHVDAIVFGRNRVGGFVGDNSVVVDRYGASRIQNLYPYKLNDNSTGTYILGNDIVGGLVGAFTDGNEGRGRREENKYDKIHGTLNYSSAYGYDNGTINYGYHVIGARAVGGVIGDYVDHSLGDTNMKYSLNFKTGFTGDYEDEKIVVRGSVCVGGITGIQEETKTFGDNNSQFRYNIKASNIEVSADAIAGGIVGAIYTRNNYFNIDKLVSGQITNTSVTSNLMAGGLTGLYAVNNSNNVLTKNLVGWNKTCENYNPDSDWNSINGLCNNENIKALKYNKDGDPSTNLNTNLNTIQSLVSGQLNSAGKTYPIVFDMSSMTAMVDNKPTYVLDNTVSITSEVYAGGAFGYIPDRDMESTTPELLTFKKYVNTAKVFTTSSINLNGVDYSYLGGIIGRVPKGVTLEDCANMSSTSDTYDSAAGKYMGGITEVNDGTVMGTRALQVLSCVNNNAYNYGSERNIAAFVGVNNGMISDVMNDASVTGNYAAGIVVENNGTVLGTVNKGDISGTYVAGIAAKSVGASSIYDSENHGFVTATSSDNYLGAAGIFYKNEGSSTVTIGNCVNTGVITANDSEDGVNWYAAGIAYDTNAQGVINFCRNYGTGLVYGVTAKDAYKLHYNLDASNSDVHIGRVDATGANEANAETRNYANFWFGERNSSIIPYTPLIIEESEEFRATQFYATFPDENITGNQVPGNQDEEYVNKDYTIVDNKIISTYVLGKEEEYTHDENAAWPLNKSDTANSYLAFRIQPVVKNKDGIHEAYTSCNKFGICWNGLSQSTTNPILGYYELRDTTYEGRYEEFIANSFEKTITDAESQSFSAIADRVFAGDYASTHNKPRQFFNGQGEGKINGRNKQRKFAYDVFYDLMEASGGGPISVYDFVEALYQYAPERAAYYNNNKKGIHEGDNTYNGQYTGSQTTTIVQAFSYRSVGYDENMNVDGILHGHFQTDVADDGTNYGSNEELDRFLFNVYCYMMEHPDPEHNFDEMEDSDKIAYYKEQLAYWIGWSASETPISLNVSLVLRDVNGYVMETQPMTTSDSIQYFDLDAMLADGTAALQKEKDENNNDVILFDMEQIKTIDVVVTGVTGADSTYQIGVNAFLWDKEDDTSGESTEDTYTCIPTVDTDNNVIDDPYVYEAGLSTEFDLEKAFELMTGKDGTNKGPIARTKLTLEQEDSSPYKIMLSDTDIPTTNTSSSGMQADEINPRASAYLDDTNTRFDDANNACIRKKVFEDLDQEYVTFINDYRPDAAEPIITGH